MARFWLVAGSKLISSPVVKMVRLPPPPSPPPSEPEPVLVPPLEQAASAPVARTIGVAARTPRRVKDAEVMGVSPERSGRTGWSGAPAGAGGARRRRGGGPAAGGRGPRRGWRGR